MEVRVGLGDTMREIEVELDESVSQDDLIRGYEEAVSSATGVWWLTDRKGKRFGIPTAKVLFLEIGANKEARRVGFSA